jgi:tRNA-modifying protein YgfZ
MKVLLKNRSLLKISGNDAETFLQNLLSNDITMLDDSNVQLNAYCQHQGKIIGLLWVMGYKSDFLLSYPLDLNELIKTRLKRFVIMSDVIIEDLSQSFMQIGLIDEISSKSFLIKANLSVLIFDLKEKYNDEVVENFEWSKACINALLPEVSIKTSEKFVPQMLNLDVDEIGVNFSKGCYPGQEVVARLHYLGSAKRRLFSFRSNQEMLVGDSLYCASSKTALARGDRYKGSGIVVSKVKYNSLFYCLATLDVDLINEEITLNNEHGPKLEKINDE